MKLFKCLVLFVIVSAMLPILNALGIGFLVHVRGFSDDCILRAVDGMLTIDYFEWGPNERILSRNRMNYLLERIFVSDPVAAFWEKSEFSSVRQYLFLFEFYQSDEGSGIVMPSITLPIFIAMLCVIRLYYLRTRPRSPRQQTE
ncbi:hypothetical protein [Stratiformator vulcanicus]|uniref:Uncharacterized protein n=1 Tax=Stratiformator vulcanicus TaxID=2527980 RepID=A0A517R636_9PLAN|nr:hypothetical protein [Stratiformator vulcanicus]QDT39329.1 hypothetical protein Pan189_37350 [Stratiformator vulcanicus]